MSETGIDFTSIAPFLQVKIAEKMDFFDRKEFEFSSSLGKSIAEFAKFTTIVEVPFIELNRYTGVTIHMKTHSGIRKQNWRNTHCGYLIDPESRQFYKVPRFRLRRICVNGIKHFDLFRELYEKTEFVPQDLILEFEQSGQEDAEAFIKITQLFPNVKECFSKYCWYRHELFAVPEFQKVETLDLQIQNIPHEVLLQLSPRTLILTDRSYPTLQVTDIASLLIQQWARKERRNWFDWFDIHTYSDGPVIDCKALFSPLLPIAEIRKFVVRTQKFKHLLEFMDIPEQKDLDEKDDVFYSINRGDKKLVVFVRMVKSVVMAKEYTVIKGAPTTKKTCQF